ncbi:hypothetical protein IV203_025580 [Nitzschia inconspicua]|uniref:DUF7769 domain-containing protein n=1 Tax=Nitzschia inconspicua TaxID=303405 RepID=A0A9K3K9E2_9STRA|nr:hypothetical protein IV203_017648 [Nitzschia inconspicua]KAG7361914.1 hypothetical protein IV203_025580 [Nitzschia inconspicua]
MGAERKKRVAVSKQLKKELFMACLMRVSRGILPKGSFQKIGESFNVHAKTVGRLWNAILRQVPEYQPTDLLDTTSLLAKIRDTALKNHRAGDVKRTNINMDRELYQHMTLDLVLLDIKKKMPPSDRNFVLQQDGARVHLSDDDPSLKVKVTELFGNEDAVKLYTQPAQSPDLNVNDLGFFNSLQSKYYEESPRNAIEIIEMVETVYKSYPMEKLNRIWLTLQSVMNEMKEGLERINELPVSLFVTEDARTHDLDTVVEV